MAAYYDLVPGFERLLELNGGDLEKFYQAADRLTHEPKAERHRRLLSLSSAAAGSTPQHASDMPVAPYSSNPAPDHPGGRAGASP